MYHYGSSAVDKGTLVDTYMYGVVALKKNLESHPEDKMHLLRSRLVNKIQRHRSLIRVR